jgi:hypothetical protein
LKKFAAAMAIAAGAFVLITPGTAHATPTVCKSGVNRYMPDAPDKGSALCTAGSGSFRLHLTCSNKSSGGVTRTFSGPWRVVGTPGTKSSAATCPSERPWGVATRVEFG